MATAFLLASGALVSGPAGASAAPAPSATEYVTNNQLATVSVVQGSTITKTIKVGNGPVGIASTPDHKTLYVADFGFLRRPAHTVTPITVATGKAGRPIVVGTGPMEIAITPDGSTALVTLQGDAQNPGHQVVAIDLATRKVSAPVEVGSNPESLAIAPDGRTAYVPAFGAAKVTPVDLTTSPPTAQSPISLPGTSPRAIAVAPNGAAAYVLDTTQATVIPIALPAGTVGTPVPLVCQKQGDPGCTPDAITISPNGRSAFIAAAGSSDVLEMSLPSLKVTSVIATGGYPDALAISGATLFVTNGAGNTMTVRRPPTSTTVSGFSYPFGVVVVPGPGRGAGGPAPTAAAAPRARLWDRPQSSGPYWGAWPPPPVGRPPAAAR